MDFNLTLYSELLVAVKTHYPATTSFLSSFQAKPGDRFAILRHDVDKNPLNALKIARMEHTMGMHGTYYFRIHPIVFKPEIIREIAAMGHEIGYHYEDFTKSHGNAEKAIESFKHNLEEFRKIYPVKTICMDGRPLSKYNNLDLWKQYDYRDYGIVGEPFLDLDFSKVLYLTDTGRGWNMVKYSVRDKVNENFNYHNISTAQLISDIQNGILPGQIMLNIHPQRWHDRSLPWLTELVLQRIKNGLKWGLIKVRGEKS